MKIKFFKTKSENSEKNALTIEEIEMLSNIDLPFGRKGMIVARDIFLFLFYAAGMRFSDVCKLEWSNISNNIIVYVMSKTRGRSGSKRTVPLKSSVLREAYRGLTAIFLLNLNRYAFQESSLTLFYIIS